MLKLPLVPPSPPRIFKSIMRKPTLLEYIPCSIFLKKDNFHPKISHHKNGIINFFRKLMRFVLCWNLLNMKENRYMKIVIAIICNYSKVIAIICNYNMLFYIIKSNASSMN